MLRAACLLVLAVAALGFDAGVSGAQALVTCTGSAIPTAITEVGYDVNSNTCAITNNSTSPASPPKMLFVAQGAGAADATYYMCAADGTAFLTITSFTVSGAGASVQPANESCARINTVGFTGTHTATGVATINGTTFTMNVSFTAHTGISTDILSATVSGGPAPPQTLSLTVSALPATFSGVGQAITFSYTVKNTGSIAASSVSVSDTKVSGITCAATTLATGTSTTCTGTYVTTAADLTATGIVSSATAHAVFASANVASSVVSTTVHTDAAAVRQATKSAIQGFLVRRADLITSMGPDTEGMHSRLSGWLFGATGGNGSSGLGGPRDDEARSMRPTGLGLGGRDSLLREDFGRGSAADAEARAASLPLRMSGAADDGAGQFTFASSLSKLRASAADEQARKEAATLPGLMNLSSGAPKPPTGSPLFDVWIEGAFSYFNADGPDGKRQGHTGLLFTGADYVVTRGLLVGVMAQFDWMEEAGTLGRDADGRGWMAGPYLSARLTPNIYLDARALWGRSDNHVDPLGAFTDSFQTSRSLVSAKLSGSWFYGAWQFRPSAEVIYFTEEQKAYTNAIGIAIDSTSVSLGRLTFGPEVAYRIALGDRATLQPFVGLKGVWDFDRTPETTAAGEPIGVAAFHGRLEAGATLQAGRMMLRASGAYDGIGDANFHAWQGRASLIVPLD